MKCETCSGKRTVVTTLSVGWTEVEPCPTCNKNGEASKNKDYSHILKKLAEV